MSDRSETMQLEKVPDWAVSLTEKVNSIRDAVQVVERQQDVILEDGRKSNQRITALEVRFDEVERRRNDSSMRAKQSSEVDAKHEAAIAALHEKTDAQTNDIAHLKQTQAEQLSILKQLQDGASKLISNPYFRVIVYAIAAYIASHLNIKLPQVPQ